MKWNRAPKTSSRCLNGGFIQISEDHPSLLYGSPPWIVVDSNRNPSPDPHGTQTLSKGSNLILSDHKFVISVADPVL